MALGWISIHQLHYITKPEITPAQCLRTCMPCKLSATYDTLPSTITRAMSCERTKRGVDKERYKNGIALMTNENTLEKSRVQHYFTTFN